MQTCPDCHASMESEVECSCGFQGEPWILVESTPNGWDCVPPGTRVVRAQFHDVEGYTRYIVPPDTQVLFFHELQPIPKDRWVKAASLAVDR